MPRLRNSVAVRVLVLLLCFTPAALAQVKTKSPATKPAAPRSVDDETARLSAEVIRTATEYRD